MDVSFKKRFIKDLSKIPNPYKLHIEKVVFEDIPNADKLEDVPNVVHMSGTEAFYQIRKGEYRIGFEYSEGKLVFFRVLHRKDIYNKFP